MVERTIPDNIKHFFDCSICFEEYSMSRYPCTLQCGHTLCQPCIQKLMSKANTITCPLDKKNFKVKILSANLSFLNLLSRVKHFYTGSTAQSHTKPLIKFTKNCRNFSRSGSCPYGETCKFLHRQQEARSPESSDSYTGSESDRYSLYDSYEDYLEFNDLSDESFYEEDSFNEWNSSSSEYW